MPWNGLALLTELLQVSMQLHAKHLHRKACGTVGTQTGGPNVGKGKRLCTADKKHGQP